MFEFLDGAGATARIRNLLETSRDVRLAVAFWGKGASSDIGLESRTGRDSNARRTQIVCNLRSGGTNPDEIELLMKSGIELMQCDTLHGKVYLFDDCFVVGSSNVSANGLAMQGRESSGWHEANVVSDDPAIFQKLSTWVEDLPIRKITDADLRAARINFNKRRQVLRDSWPPRIGLFDALVVWPERFADKNIFVTFYIDGLNDIQLQDIELQGRQEENIGQRIEGVGFKLKPSSTYFGFWLDAETREVTFDGYFRTRDYEWTNERPIRNRVWYCEIVDEIIGVRRLGPLSSWSKAILAADSDIANGVILDESIEIVDFYRRYIERNPDLGDAVGRAKKRFGG